MGRMTPFYTRLIRSGFKKRFFLAKMTKVPLIGKTMEIAFFGGDDIIILPKDEVAIATQAKRKTIDLNIQAEPSNVMVPSQVIEHFIRNSRYRFLMNCCMCRSSNHCEHYPANLGCIFLGKDVTKIDPKMGRLVSVEKALEHLRKCREAGLVHLIGRDKIDSVWLGTKKENLLSICSCCPCCCLWKMLPNVNSSIAGTVTKMPGVEVMVDASKCVGCGTCVEKYPCYLDAMKIMDKKAVIDQATCRGCARCVEICPKGAISLRITDWDFVEQAIERIEPLVDVTAE